jgi:hypothetical protein
MGPVTEYNDNLAAVNYNALQVSAQHRMSRGLQFGASYVFSKALGTCGAVVPATGSGNMCSIDDPYHNYRQWYYGPLNWDTRHNFSLNYTYTFPKVTANHALKYVGNGWTLSGIIEAQTGQPITPSCVAYSVLPNAAQTDPSLTGQGFFSPSGFFASGTGARCELVGNLKDYQHSFNENFNVNALALAPTGTFGNSGIGILRSPAWWNMDANLQKTIPLGSEKRILQLRIEAYNVLNHTEFNGIGSALTMLYLPFDPTPMNISTNLGQYTSTRPPRVLATTLRFQF